MTPAELARDNAISFECKKDALQQRQSGDWKISFTVQGVDMDERITRAAMGTRFVAVLVEVNDQELPVKQPAKDKATSATPKPTAGAKRPKRDWRDVPPSQQAGIRCDEPTFAAFLRETRPDDWHESGDDPAECVRLISGVTSRALIASSQRARVIWHQLDSEYQAWEAKERVGA